ncbi:MAG: tripartite tricarboxylate transporter permease, partial [Chloroflexi bacterium]|nr:tripartite tricarboxylate transporter permease [Chloroflexota bacterium]
RGALLIPFILLLVFLGGFAVKNAPEDVAMVIVFGLLGWVMVRYDWPRPPILLGLVLGGIAESNLFIATQAYGTLGWITRPGVIFLGLVMVGSVAYAIRRDMKRRSAAAAELSDVRDVSDTA